MTHPFSKVLKAGFVFLILAAGFNEAQAQVLSSSSLQNPFDSAGASARAMALGGAFVGVADDSSALFFNPAGLAALKGTDFTLHHQLGLAGIWQDVLAVGVPLGKGAGLGFTGNFVNYGTFDGRAADGTPIAGPTANQFGGGFGGGLELAKGLYAGVAVEGTLQQLASNSYGLINGNVGLLYSLPQGWRFGASYEGWGTATGSATASSVVRVGGSKAFTSKDPLALLTALSYTYEPQFGSEVLAGMEVSYKSNYFLRVGYQADLQDSGLTGLQGLTAGAGVAFSGFQLDYAFIPFADLGSTNRISLGYRFGAEPPAVQTAAKTVGHQSSPGTAQVQPQPASSSQTGQSLTLQFDMPSPQVAQGKALEQQGQWNQALSAYLAAVKDNPQNAEAWWRMGNIYYRLRYKDYAVQCFEKVIQLKPEAQSLGDWLEKYKNQAPAPATKP